jgi:cell division protein FtsB
MPLSKKVTSIYWLNRFIKKTLGSPSDTDVEQLKADNEKLKMDKAELQKKIEALEDEVTYFSE